MLATQRQAMYNLPYLCLCAATGMSAMGKSICIYYHSITTNEKTFDELRSAN